MNKIRVSLTNEETVGDEIQKVERNNIGSENRVGNIKTPAVVNVPHSYPSILVDSQQGYGYLVGVVL